MKRCAGLFLLPALLVACAGQQQPLAGPPIVQVGAWGGMPVEPPRKAQIIRHITLHHQGAAWAAGDDVQAYLRRLQLWSQQSKRWTDIPYHYVIAPDGRIYAARDEARPADTNTGSDYDPQGHVAVMLMGNFETAEPGRLQLSATVELMGWLARRHGLAPDAIAAHKDYSGQTLCPGKNLYAYVESGWLQREVAARLAAPDMPSLSLAPGHAGAADRAP